MVLLSSSLRAAGQVDIAVLVVSGHEALALVQGQVGLQGLLGGKTKTFQFFKKSAS